MHRAIFIIRTIKIKYTQAILVLPQSFSIFVRIFFKKLTIGSFSIKLFLKFISLIAFRVKNINAKICRYNANAHKIEFNFNCSTSNEDIKVKLSS